MRLVCPYCFEKLGGTSPAFRCINPDPTRCPLEEDHELARYKRLTAERLPRVFPVKRPMFGDINFGVCSCGTKTTKRVCQHCHNELPGQFGTTDSFTIALIGAKEVGKSNYIAVLIHELMNRVGQQFNWSLSAIDEQTRRRYRNDFGRYLYERREVVPTTDSARVRMDVRYPLAYRLVLEQRRLGLFSHRRATSLVFFDTAGEDMKCIDVMSTEAKYIANSDGLIFLLDPLQIQSVRDRLANQIQLPQEAHDPQEILECVDDLVRRMRNIKPPVKIDTPVAVAFSKIDAVRPLIDPGSPIHHASLHAGRFDVADADVMNANMRSHVAEWGGACIDRFLYNNFATYSYFGLSALGTSPDAGRLPMGVSPFRVEDPFLWMLHRFGVIPGGHGTR